MSFSKSILKFFNHSVVDNDFHKKININNVHLLPLKDCNLNLKTLRTEGRSEHQRFTQCVDLKGVDF